MTGRRAARPGRTACAAVLATVSLALPAPQPVRAAGMEAVSGIHAGDSLPAWLAAVADGALARAHWGVAVYDLDARRWVIQHHADMYFVPASNLKLVVTAAALARLGPDYRYRTSVYGTEPVGGNGVLDGDLVLYGRGDPNLSGRYAPTMTAIYEALADSLAARGLERVTGDLVADESHWDADHVRGDWAAYDLLWWYAAPVGALGFNDNSIDFHIRPAARIGLPPMIEGDPESSFYSLANRARTGPPGGASTFDLTRDPGTNRITAYGTLPLDAESRTEYFAVVDPAGWAGTVFREVLARRGIEVGGGVRTVSVGPASAVATGDTVALAAHESPPLARVIESVNGRSQNWHAEQLVKTLGREIAGEGSWSAGLAVERETLASLGVDTTAFILRDASGLSSVNLATPRGLVDLLVQMQRRLQGEVYAASLPVAGESGSLKSRFVNTVGEGRIRAKTGYIENVAALSGYLTTLSGRRYAFSVIVNGTGGEGADEATGAIDRLVNAIIAGKAP